LTTVSFFETAFGGFARPGSSTDLTTNVTRFASVELIRHLKPLSEGFLPPELLGGLLHEIEHHTCFVSPVGSALFLLKMRLLRDAVAVTEGDEARLPNFISDYLTYTAAIEVLRPVAEGIALFTELDAWSLEHLQGCDSLAIAQFFCRRVITDTNYGDSANAFRWFIQLSRQLEENFEAKASLLAMSLKHELSFYLLGYLMIKTLWRAHHSRTKRTSDGSQFIAYLTAYFYWDLGIVSCLLDQSQPSASGRANRVLGRVVERYQQLIRADTDKLVEAFRTGTLEAATDEPLPRLANSSGIREDDLPAFRGILQSSDDVQSGRKRFMRLHDEVMQTHHVGKDQTLASAISTLAESIFAQRQYLCLGADAVQVEVDETGSVRAFQNTILRARGKALAGTRPGKEDGWIEVHLIKLPPQLVLTIYRGSQIVLSNVEDRGPYEWRSQFLAKPPENLTQRALQELEASASFLVGKLEAKGSLVDSGAHWLADVAKDKLQREALLPFSSRSQDLANEIESWGLWNILERDADFLRAYAKVSLLTQTFTQKSEVRDILRADGVDLDAVLARVRASEQRWKCELVLQTDDVVMCLL
jgi:hypothetical protein